ncbi:MAG: hypothetical protein IPH45_09200 [Bacteroidales bacterium]|nr:hypothetical protein [Bacteroidales bacterium]
MNNPVLGADAQAIIFNNDLGRGDGQFNNDNILHPLYYPGNIDFSVGYVNLILQVLGTGACQFHSVTDDKRIFISQYPVIDAGPDNFICNTQLSYGLSGNSLNANADSLHWTFSGEMVFKHR